MKPKIGDTVQFKKSGITGTVEKIIRGACVVKTPVSRLSAWPEDLIIVGLSEVSLDKEMEEHQKLCDEIMDIQEIKPIEAEMEEVIHCPEGYIFKDENGNVIDATKIFLEKKKKEYPKSYKECLAMTSYDKEERLLYLLDKFKQLLICRDAYWKIAGEEMGLGRPWEPDWENKEEEKYTIEYFAGMVYKDHSSSCSRPFAFPTEEMRDSFKKNFDPDIEICKEFL